MTLFNQVQSILILTLMVIGVFFARQKKRDLHIKTMSAAMIWDLLLVLQVEFGRSAIANAMKIQTNHPLLTIHILLALSSLVFYVLMVRSGRHVLQNKTEYFPLHRKLGLVTLTLRALTLGTSLWYTFLIKPYLS
jgi:uncharacterized membrane protein YozB (DUF420 family)